MKTIKIMGKSRIHNEIKELTDLQLREAIQSLQNVTWKENDLLRVLARKIHGEDNIMTMLNLAVPLAVELEQRTRKGNLRELMILDDPYNSEECNTIKQKKDFKKKYEGIIKKRLQSK